MTGVMTFRGLKSDVAFGLVGARKQEDLTGSPSLTAIAGRDAAFVEFDHVQKSYDGETLVVKDLNLAIGKG